MKPHSELRPTVEILESRIAPAVHTWTGAGLDNLWSNPTNWTGGSPSSDGSGNIDLVFPTNAAQLVIQNDIINLTVDSITFSAAGGTSANGYTINGNTIIINTGATGEDPFGIDVAAGVADTTAGITQVFNAGLTLATNDATFRSAQASSRLTFHGDINLGGRTLTINNTSGGGNNANLQGFIIDGDISNGNVSKTGSGTLELSGDNSFTNFTTSGGFALVGTESALGATAGTITANDPGQVQLRNGITVEKTTLNLNSNSTGGGLGADGGTTNTFRGAVVLMVGNGGVALGAGFGAANASTRLIIDGVISGATSTLFINGTGVVEFATNNTYTGVTNLNGNQGPSTLQIDTPAGLGAGGNGNDLNVSVGNSVLLNFDGTLRDAGATAENIQFAGAGIGKLGAIRVAGDHDVVVSGTLTLVAGSPWTVGVDGVDGSLSTTGVISSQGANRGLAKVGAGTLVIGGAGANTFVGGVAVNGGLVSVTNTTATPLGVSSGLVTVSHGSTLLVQTGVSIPNAVALVGGASITGAGTVASIFSSGGAVRPGVDTGRLTTGSVVLDSTSEFIVDVHGTVAGTTLDQLTVNGAVVLDGATLTLVSDFTATPGDQFRIIDNTSSNPVIGTFAGLPQGATFSVNGQGFQISYTSGNDVVLTALATPANDLTVAANGKSATYTDVDGDLVTVKIQGKTAKLAPGDFTFGFSAGALPQLIKLALDSDDFGASLTITSKRTAAGGDGYSNIGLIDATGIALSSVRIDGDLGRMNAGAVKLITVQSLGALGLATQGGNGDLVSNLTGNLGKLVVKASVHDATVLGTGSIGAVMIVGSFLGGRLSAGADLGVVTVRGDIIGTADSPVVITGFGKLNGPSKGTDLAIKSLKVSGGVDSLRLLAGYDLALAGVNADASIGSIFVSADWRASSVLAGVSEGVDGFAGTADDLKLATGGVRDTAGIFSAIASITIKGQAFGSVGGGDSFGIVAEQIKKASVAKAALKLDKGERDAADAFALASTGPGATELPSDFFLREAIL